MLFSLTGVFGWSATADEAVARSDSTVVALTIVYRHRHASGLRNTKDKNETEP